MTTTSEQQTIDPKVISRIQKMLNLARDGAATEGEARNAMDAAEATMRKYNLTMAQVEAGGGAGGEGSKRTKDSVKGRAQYEFQQQLMLACAEVNYCVVLKTAQWKGNRSMVTGYTLIGREANVIATRELYDYLNATTERLAFEYVGSDNRQRLSRRAISFKKGCAERLGQRLRERHQESLEEQAREARARNAGPASSGTALVVVMKDFAQDEADANEDLRWGQPEGTTAAHRRRSAAESLVYRAASAAIQSCESNDRDELLAAGLNAAGPVALAQGVPEVRMRTFVENIVEMKLAHLNAPEETLSEKLKRQDRERKENERFWNRQRREREREDANTDWTAKHAGSRAGENVGLDKQITEAQTAAGRLR